jgi:hypothetical protein
LHLGRGGHSAPLAAQAFISAAKVDAVPGAGCRPGPGAQVQSTSGSVAICSTIWASVFTPLRSLSLIWAQIWWSESPASANDRGAMRLDLIRRYGVVVRGLVARVAVQSRQAVAVVAAEHQTQVRVYFVTEAPRSRILYWAVGAARAAGAGVLLWRAIRVRR